jgi:uncharacterized LabA/DUF88 family protein
VDKVAIFVDVQNIYYTVKQKYNCHFNYNEFWEQATYGRQVARAVAYATYKGDEKQTNFQNILRKIGFEVKLSPFIQRKDGSTKGDWDVGITVDMIDYSKHVSTIVLASGDGDYTMVVNDIIKRHGVAVEVFGVPGLTATSLINSASHFVPIESNLLLQIPETW